MNQNDKIISNKLSNISLKTPQKLKISLITTVSDVK